MRKTAAQLTETIRGFIGGSEQRYRHPFNRAFIYSEGVKQVAEAAGAYWLLDTVALKMAPIYAKAWLANETGIGIVKLKVFTEVERAADPAERAARLSLSLSDETPAAYEERIDYTDFPEGEWVFFLGTDEVGPESYVSNLYLDVEH